MTYQDCNRLPFYTSTVVTVSHTQDGLETATIIYLLTMYIVCSPKNNNAIQYH